MSTRTRELDAALEREAATRQILQVINRSPDDYEPVFDAILERGTHLCGAQCGLLLLRESDGFHIVAHRGTRPEVAAYYHAHPVPLDPERTVAARTVAERRPLQVLDAADDAVYHAGMEHRRLAVEFDGLRSQLTVPLVRDDEGIGVILIYRREVRAFDDAQVALLSGFAEMAVIALENVRRFRALGESLERQTATSGILRVISRSPTDYQPVFDTILENATRLCDAPLAQLYLVGDGGVHPVANRGTRKEFLDFLRDNVRPAGREAGAIGRALGGRMSVQVHDIAGEDLYRGGDKWRVAAVELEGIRTLVTVPLLKGEEAIGVIVLYRREVRPFDARHVNLVETFADQAVIAIENVRQFHRVEERTAALTRSLERQTATSEILRAISRSPTDYAPVFQTILENATRLCRARTGVLYLLRDGHLHLAADRGTQPELLGYLKANPLPLDWEDGVVPRAARERIPHQRTNVDEQVYGDRDGIRKNTVALGGLRTLLAVPLLKGSEAIGVLAFSRREAEPFPPEDIELVRSFADQAVIAIENVRLFQALEERNAELNASLERQTATSEILRTISRSPTDYAPVFDTILDNATRLCDAPLAFLLIREGDAFHFVAHRGSRPEFVDFVRANPVPMNSEGTLAGLAARSGVPQQLANIVDSEGYRAGNIHRVASADLEGIRTGLFVPMMKGEHCVGIIALYRREVRTFHDSHIALVSTFADQAVIAVDNVRLFRQLEQRNAALNEALERQTATSEILRAISRSPTDYQPVFEVILENATRLCGAPFGALWLVREDHVDLVADFGGKTEFNDWLRRNPLPLDRQAPVSTAAREGVPVHELDIMDDVYRSGDEVRRWAVDVGGWRTLLAIPLLKGEEVMGVIGLYRQEVQAFKESEIELVSTFADQAVIAIENVRSFQEIQARTAALTQSLERQTATSEILRAISQSPTDYQPVFEVILENALRLCHAPLGILLLRRGDHLHFVASTGDSPAFVEFLKTNPFPLSRRHGITARAAIEQVPVQAPDMAALPREDSDRHRSTGVETEGIRTLLAVPMLKGDETVGVIALYRREVKSFQDDEVKLVSTFADQAVIAIENVRSFQAVQARTAELTQSLERQTATSEILRTISQSPTDYQPVFETILENATRLCGAPFGSLFLVRDDHLHFVADAGSRPEFVEYLRANPYPLDHPVAVISRAARERAPRQLADLMDAAYQSGDDRRISGVEIGGLRTLLCVPLLKGDEVVGVIALYRQQVKAFADDDIELVSTFADQAVIAIENVRSFKEIQTRTAALTQSLERQTATSEILRTISQSPTDYQPVFNTILHNAVRLCGAPFGSLFLLRDDHLHFVADAGSRPEFQSYLRANPFPLNHPAAIICRAARDGEPRQAADLADEVYRAGDYRRKASVDIGGIRTLLGVPMLKSGETVGIIALYRREVKPFADADIQLVETFADQAVIAIENVRLFEELESRSAELARSVAELEALGEVAQAVSSSLDLETVLNTIVERAVELSGAHAGAIHELDEVTGKLPPRAAPNLEELLDLPAPRLGEGAVGRAATTRAPVQIPDITVPGAYTGVLLDALAHLRIRALLAVPMVQDERVLGTLVVARRTPGEFPPDTVRVLRALGTQSAIAIRNAQLFREIEDKSRELEAANRHKSEFLANMSHELRTPLNAVIGFSEVLGERMFGDLNEKQAEYVHDIHDSGRHLLSLINDILDLSKIEAGAMELDVSRFALAPALDNALTLVKERAGRRGISLESKVDGDLGEIEGDERKLKQILLNLLSNAIKFTGEGGRVTLEAHRSDATVEIAVRDTGVGISKEDQAVIFQEFRQVGTDYARKVEGTGLGLTLTQRFVEMHGGAIAVESEPGAGSVFRVSLPLEPTEPTVREVQQ